VKDSTPLVFPPQFLQLEVVSAAISATMASVLRWRH
jgi:hypothetical protein